MLITRCRVCLPSHRLLVSHTLAAAHLESLSADKKGGSKTSATEYDSCLGEAPAQGQTIYMAKLKIDWAQTRDWRDSDLTGAELISISSLRINTTKLLPFPRQAITFPTAVTVGCLAAFDAASSRAPGSAMVPRRPVVVGLLARERTIIRSSR